MTAVSGWADDAPPPAFDADTQEKDAWMNRAEIAKQNAARAANLESRKMSREDFLKKYGKTFVADDKGGNAASEVAGQDVGQYYDTYLADGVAPRTMRVGGDGSTDEVPWNWGSGTTRDKLKQQIGLDAWSYVDPHPESNQQDGWNDAWQQIGKPVAMAAAMYTGVGALNGAAGAGVAEGTAGTTTGTTAGTTALGDSVPLSAADATALQAPQATGLAGQLGMNAGYGANALNTGALNTGMSLARGKNVGDSLKDGATAAALSPISTYVAGAAGGGTVGTLAGNTALGAAQGAVNGGGIINGARNGFVNGIASVVGKSVGGWAKDETGSDTAAWVAKTGAKTAVNGALTKKKVAKPINVKTGGWA